MLTNEERPWLHPDLAALLDKDIVEACTKSKVMDRDAIQLQLCREISKLTQAFSSHSNHDVK